MLSEDYFSTGLAKKIRKSILTVSHAKQSPHVGSCLSCVEILISAYGTKYEFKQNGNDNCKVVFSKGHASLALYCTLVEFGALPQVALEQYNESNSHYYGHVSHKASTDIELSTGSLGHGLPFAIGLALSNKYKLVPNVPVITIMSDGECDEGTTWESALLASHLGLSNLIVVVDRNRLQSLTSTEETLQLEPFAKKWESFGWEVFEVDGHNVGSLSELLKIGNRPRCIIANTHKGYGVSFMRDSVDWHYKSPNDVQFADALDDIEGLE